ncbi:unnamed protein product [Urochloa humidicola]
MASNGGGSDGSSSSQEARMPGTPDPSVAELLQRLNLTAEEGGIAEFSDDEDNGEPAVTTEWALLGKVLSPSTLHVSTIIGAMRPAWGNPYGLKIRSISDKGDNLFVAHFGCRQDMEKALAGSPWVVRKHDNEGV